MRARYLILAFGVLANSSLWADEYPISGVWANASAVAADADTFCRSYWKNPKAPIGPVVVFRGSKRTDYNSGYLEVEVVNNIAVRKSAPNEYSIVDQYYDDGEMGARPGKKRRAYKLRILAENKIEMRAAQYQSEVFVKCSPPPQAANREGGITGPSFDCSKASLPDEKVICGDEKLGELDRLIGASYTEVRNKLGGQTNRRARSFLSKRHQCGAGKLCILDAQLEALKGYKELGSSAVLPQWIASYRLSLAREGSVLSSISAPNKPTEAHLESSKQQSGALVGTQDESTAEKSTASAKVIREAGVEKTNDQIPSPVQQASPQLLRTTKFRGVFIGMDRAAIDALGMTDFEVKFKESDTKPDPCDNSREASCKLAGALGLLKKAPAKANFISKLSNTTCASLDFDKNGEVERLVFSKCFFGASDLEFNAFAQAIISNYEIGRLDCKSDLDTPLGRQYAREGVLPPNPRTCTGLAKTGEKVTLTTGGFIKSDMTVEKPTERPNFN